MDISERKVRQSNRDSTLYMIPVVALIGKLIQFYILPDKYFYDSERMIGMLNGVKGIGEWSGYESTVDIFRKINFFGFSSRGQWSIFLGIIFTILFMILISKVKEMSMMESVYTLMAIGLLNIYVFNIAKEPVQMSFFIVILVVMLLPFDNSLIKIIGCALVYYWESNTFRSYYIIMAAMSLVLYVVFAWIKKRKGDTSKIEIIIVILLCFVVTLAFFYASQYVDKDSYTEAVNIRDVSPNENASTAILNTVEVNGNFGKFAYNYVINSIRMLVPIELLVKGVGYIPFVVYQFFILFYWIRGIKNIKNANTRVLLSLSCFTAYLFGSFVFEPDFGSWVRHEAASFPIFYILAYEDLGKGD